MIEVTNLTKKYGDHTAVDSLSFRVERGQIYGFLGPNGAGKSTTMNMITGYLAPTDGTVVIDGHDVQKEPEEVKKHIGYLPEQPPLYMDMTVREYLKFVAELKKVPAKDRADQIGEVMRMTGITDMAGRLIKNLSKGYRQRVGLAQAIIGYPEVIILDEPSVGLDPKQIIEMRDLIRELGKNHTVILSSHILSEVSAVCDHIMIIAHGRLVASDSAEGLQKRIAGSGELELKVKGSREELDKVLTGMSSIEKIEKLDEAEQGTTSVRLTVEKDTDIREPLFFALAEAKLPILSLTYVQKTLEDIFLELTGNAPEPTEKKSRFAAKKQKKKKPGDELNAEEAAIAEKQADTANAEGKEEE